MAVVSRELDVPSASLFSSGIPELVHVNGSAGSGTEIAFDGYSFDATAQEQIYWTFFCPQYGGGNLTVLCDFYSSATSGTVTFGARIGAVTPTTDNAALTAKATSTETSGTTTVASTAGRLYRQSITVSNLDSLATDDRVFLRLCRLAADTAAADAVLVGCVVQWNT
jgi:hypothetical protein